MLGIHLHPTPKAVDGYLLRGSKKTAGAGTMIGPVLKIGKRGGRVDMRETMVFLQKSVGEQTMRGGWMSQAEIVDHPHGQSDLTSVDIGDRRTTTAT